MRVSMRGAATLLLVTLAGAGWSCAGQPEAPGPSLTVGPAGASFTLAAVDGQPLPALAYFGVDVSARATAGTLTLGADQTYALHVDYVRHFASGNRDVAFALAEQGTWSASGSTLVLTPAGGSSYKATSSGSDLTVTLTAPGSEPPERGAKPYTFVKG